jgi:hypothetical protein
MVPEAPGRTVFWQNQPIGSVNYRPDGRLSGHVKYRGEELVIENENAVHAAALYPLLERWCRNLDRKAAIIVQAQQPGKPKPPGNPPTSPAEPQRPAPVEEPPRPIPVPAPDEPAKPIRTDKD